MMGNNSKMLQFPSIVQLNYNGRIKKFAKLRVTLLNTNDFNSVNKHSATEIPP